jgi:hypothetical protein
MVKKNDGKKPRRRRSRAARERAKNGLAVLKEAGYCLSDTRPKRSKAEKDNGSARFVSEGVYCEMRVVGSVAWQPHKLKCWVRVQSDAVADSLGRVVFRVADVEFRVGVKQIRLGRPGLGDAKPSTSSADPTNWKKIDPGPQSPVTRGKGASRRKSQRALKAWRNRSGG